MKVELITGSTILESVKNTFKNIDVKDVDTEYFIVVPDRFTLKAEVYYLILSVYPRFLI